MLFAYSKTGRKMDQPSQDTNHTKGRISNSKGIGFPSFSQFLVITAAYSQNNGRENNTKGTLNKGSFVWCSLMHNKNRKGSLFRLLCAATKRKGDGGK